MDISQLDKVLNTTFLCITIVLTVVGNVIALAAYCVSHELHKITYYFIVNLCISDITVAMLSMPFWISFVLTGWPNAESSGAIYTFWLCLDMFCGTWSIMSLAMISVERHMSIVYPMKYQYLMTNQRAAVMIAFVFVYSSGAALLGYIERENPEDIEGYYIFIVAFAIPILIKCYCYGGIYKEARAQQRNIEQFGKVYGYFKDKNENSKHCNGQGEASRTWYRSRGSTVNEYSVTFVKTKASEFKRFLSRDSGGRQSCSGEDNDDEWGFGSAHKGIAKGNNCLCCFSGKENDNTGPHEQKKATAENIAEVDEPVFYDSDLGFGPGSNSSPCPDVARHESYTGHSSAESKHRRRAASCPVGLRSNRSLRRGEENVNQIGGTLEVDFPMTPVSARQMQKKPSLSSEIKTKGVVTFRKFRRELKAAKILGLIMGTFLVLWAPFMLYVFIDSLGVPVSYDMSLILFLKDLHYWNSAINPILYVILNKGLRRGGRKILIRLGFVKRRAETIFV